MECIHAAHLLNIRNHANVAAALGATPSPVDDLRYIRNFFAHRNMTTAGRVRGVAARLGLPTSYSALQIVTELRVPGVIVLEEWIMNLRTLAAAAIVFP